MSNQETHGSVKEYVVGLILSLALTILPFWLVWGRVEAVKAGNVADAMSVGTIMGIVLICVIAQLLVQGLFFLHMASKSQFWNQSSAVYIIANVIFFVVGTIWIFNHLSHNMLMGH